MDILGLLLKAILYPVKSGGRAKQAKPGGPDMPGDNKAFGVNVKDDPVQLRGIQPQDRPAVRGQVAQPGEVVIDLIHGLKRGGKDDVVDAVAAVILRIDTAYLGG